MKTFALDRFSGLDTRPGQYGEDNPSLVQAENLTLLPGGAIGRAPALQRIVALHAESVGLYARGGKLRAVVPSGHEIQDTQPWIVTYDPIGKDGTAYPLGKLTRLAAADTYGASDLFGAYGYVVVERNDTLVPEHHWIKDPPTDTADGVTTQVVLGFKPGMSLAKLATKFFTPSPGEGTVHFSSTEFGPINWTALEDAGFLPVLQHVSGERSVLSVAQFRGRLAVFFRDAIQLWRVDADPGLHDLEQVMNGPGAIIAGAIANFLGDIIYLSRGGFRTLSTVAVTGEANEKDIGSFIKTLTQTLTGEETATAIWSQARSQFLCAIGTRMYAFTFIPGEDQQGWTTWEMPIAIDYMVELDGVIYVRTGNVLYKFVDDEEFDFNGDPVSSVFETRQLALGAPGKLKTLHYLNIRQTQPARWQMIVDGVALPSRMVPACSPKSIRMPIAGEGRQIAIRVTSDKNWRLEGLAIDYETQAL
jgi:hypothetical protein